MKTEVGLNWNQSIHFDKLFYRNCPFSAPNEHHHAQKEHKRFDAILTGWVSNISSRTNIFVDFLLKHCAALKYHN